MRASLPQDLWRDLVGHSTLVRRLAWRLVRDVDETEDLVQDTWLAALERQPDTRHDLRPWLTRVVRNLAALRARTRERRLRRENDTARSEATPAFLDAYERRIRSEEVRACVSSLDEPYRSAILMHFFDDLPTREIARRKGLPVETVRTHLQRGMKMLRSRLDRRTKPRQSLHGVIAALLAWSRGLDPAEGHPDLLHRIVRRSAVACTGLFAILVGVLLWTGLRSAGAPNSFSASEASAREATLVSGLESPAAPSNGRIPVQPRQLDSWLTARPAGTRLSGRVLDQDAHPAAGARVRAVLADALTPPGLMHPRIERQTRTDANGEFRLDALPQKFAVTAFTQSQVAEEWLAVDGEGDLDLEGLELCLSPRWSLSGRVLDDLAAPLAGMEVRVGTVRLRDEGRPGAHPATAYLKRNFSCTTDADGRFSFPDLAWEPIALTALCPSRGSITRRLEPGAQGIDLVMPRGVSLSVRSEDIPLVSTPQPDLTLLVTRVWTPRKPNGPPSASTWFFEGLPAGQWGLLRVEGEGLATEILGPFRIQDPMDPLRLHLGPGRCLTGTVLADGGGVAGAEVVVTAAFDLDEALGLWFFPTTLGALRRLGQATTDASGRFTLTGLTESDVVLEVTPPGAPGPTCRQPLPARATRTVLRLDDSLRQPAIVEGRVADAASGKGVPGSSICAVPKGGAQVGSLVRGQAVDADGAYRLTLPAPARWYLLVRAAGYAPAVRFPVGDAAGPSRVDVELFPACRARLRLLDHRREPVAGAVVSISDELGEPILVPVRPTWLQSRVLSGADGVVHLHGLPARAVRLRVSLPDLGFARVLELDPTIAATGIQDLLLEDLDSSLERRVVEVSLLLAAPGSAGGPAEAGDRVGSAAFEGRCRVGVYDSERRLVSEWTGLVAPGASLADDPPADLMLRVDPEGTPDLLGPTEQPVAKLDPEMEGGPATAGSAFRMSFPARPSRVVIEAQGLRPLEFDWDAGAYPPDSIPRLCAELSR